MDRQQSFEALRACALDLCDEGDMMGGARALEELVGLAREMDDPARLIDALTEFGGLIKYLERFSQAEAACLEVCCLLETHFPESRAQYANALVNLGNLYRMMGNAAGAEKYMKAAMELEQAEGLTDTEDYAGLCNNLALLYQQTGRWEEALVLHRRNLDYLERTEGPRYQMGTSYNNMAALWLKLGDTAEAEKAVQKSLACYDGEVSRDSALWLTALNTLAAVHCAAGREEEGYLLLSREVEPLCAAVYGRDSTPYQGVRKSLDALRARLDREE